ncbi:MAG: type III pantothenate kinase [Saprospiraceae bacterium]
MMNYLVIDFGNTFAKLAIFNSSSEIQFEDRAEEFTIGQLRDLVSQFEIGDGIYSSTRDLSPEFEEYWASTKFKVLDTDFPWSFDSEYITPKTLGRDRIAGIAGANALFPKRNNLIIDIGTCITYDLVTANRLHLGGAISPGIDMRLKAMHDYTDRLPLVSKSATTVFLGTSTEEALQAGGVGGVLLEIGTYIDNLANSFEDLNVMLTGGDADFVHSHLNYKMTVQAKLVLIGLFEMLKKNAK